MNAGGKRRGGPQRPAVMSPEHVAEVRRRLLHRVLTETHPRSDVTPPPVDAGPLSEVLDLRRRLDEALRAEDVEQVVALRAEARRLLAAEAVEG